MSKVMVVEDDASLREIYSIRITAEGYDVVSAGDGEEALAVAVREKPDLILSDVMMPKISGFDMLDILRSTPETAKIKVVMMTALSSEDQRQRGERLGRDSQTGDQFSRRLAPQRGKAATGVLWGQLHGHRNSEAGGAAFRRGRGDRTRGDRFDPALDPPGCARRDRAGAAAALRRGDGGARRPVDG